MKKRILMLSLLAVCLSLCIGGTLAYYSSSEIARNVITAGNIKIELIETDGEGNPFQDVSGVLPGMDIDKVVTVKNTGDNACWVRIAVEKEILLDKGVEGEPDVSVIGIDFNDTDWTEEDGYYYYNNKLEPSETTEALFTKVTFAGREMGNMYQKCKAHVTVKVEATQWANNGDNVMDAKGWPNA